MQHRRLGKSAIVVSDICMGTMTFGSQADEATAFRVLDACFDAGINFYDTAEGYPVPPSPEWVGRTEDIVGRWLKTKPRDAIILATKVSGPSHVWFKSPKRSGMTALDRHNITRAIEESLTRLGTDYIDLYQTHWPDAGLAYDETMEVLDELVRAGKVRVVGCSNETSWGLMKSLATSERLGTVRYETIQNNFSLLNRRFEDELAQVCRQEGVSLIPYSPIAGGVLAGKYSAGARPDGARFSSYFGMGGRQADMASRFVNDRSVEAADRYAAIARELGLDPVTFAVAWSKQHDFVASTIVGVSTLEQLAPILAAADLVLPDAAMKAAYKVHRDILYPMG
ncbi:aldo/keto reductase [Novosphingobium cyanobacteriorum]|uniref:Aldo/keto reductase n=1 Tax=Novosphingobium cyanobacteriorum TaxID=3024215 RepID=A0ABT6CMU5_9SPHN|nr:aldo/keto reductase [Novosphingobium cyanobacteriorum]MDF8334395.1 aldo/keto reductase [Novosphingobium cyanobacteriorum]